MKYRSRKQVPSFLCSMPHTFTVEARLTSLGLLENPNRPEINIKLLSFKQRTQTSHANNVCKNILFSPRRKGVEQTGFSERSWHQLSESPSEYTVYNIENRTQAGACTLRNLRKSDNIWTKTTTSKMQIELTFRCLQMLLSKPTIPTTFKQFGRTITCMRLSQRQDSQQHPIRHHPASHLKICIFY